MIDLPPMMQERVVCSIAAATKYGVAANIILAIAEREGGRPGQWVRNANASYDLGTMQFNTSYVATLARYGIGTADVLKAGCYPYDLAAWRLRGHIMHDGGDLWTRVANYHSRTPRFNRPYRALIMAAGARWGRWLTARYRTIPTTLPGAVAAPMTVTVSLGRANPDQVVAVNYVPRTIAISGH